MSSIERTLVAVLDALPFAVAGVVLVYLGTQGRWDGFQPALVAAAVGVGTLGSFALVSYAFADERRFVLLRAVLLRWWVWI